MASVDWSEPAPANLLDIRLYIAGLNPAAARDMVERIVSRADQLAENTRLGPPGRMRGTRELLAHRSYRIGYQETAEHVLILRVLHTARRWP